MELLRGADASREAGWYPQQPSVSLNRELAPSPPLFEVNVNVARRPRFSRFRRLPGIYRIGERKRPDPDLEPQRLTLYLPAGALDEAEAQAMRAGVETIQEYCQGLLERAIDLEHAREVVAETEAKRGSFEGLHEIANDPHYLAEWSGLSAGALREPPATPHEDPRAENNAQNPAANDSAERSGLEPQSDPLPPALTAEASPAPVEPSAAARVILRHAVLLGDEPGALLAMLRRGEPIDPATGQELLQALAELEVQHRSSGQLDRRVAYALHRLAFEGEILITNAWSGMMPDEGTVDLLRIVQEAVDRVLSGEDIRYFAPDADPERRL